MIIKIICAGENCFSKVYEKDEDEFIIAVDAGIKILDDLKITADVAIGDFDSCDIDKYSNYKKIIKYNSHKDKSDLNLALDYASKLNPEKIIIYNATGMRIDHLFANILLLENYGDNVFIIDSHNKIFTLSKNIVLKANDYKYVSFFALEEGTIISLKGFEYELDNYCLNPSDPLCLSNEIKEEGIVTINKKILVMMSK